MDTAGISDPCLLGAADLARAIAAKRLSPVEVMDALLARIERLEPKLHAFVNVYGASARTAAEAADKAIRSGHAVGPLHGVPVALKDLIDLEGQITTGGSASQRQRRSTVTATIAKRMIAQGMIGHALESVGCRHRPHPRRLQQRLRRRRRRAPHALGDRH